MTFHMFHRAFTNQTLNLVLKNLQQWKDMTFIWAEISFFQLWWNEISEEDKEIAKSLIKSGRFEIVNGGYVMPDEATTHFFAVLHQYVYGKSKKSNFHRFYSILMIFRASMVEN